MGYNNAVNGIAIDTGFLNSHSKNWQIGYNDGWNAGKGIMESNQQSESSSVNIKGDDNRVTVNHRESSFQGGVADGGGNSYHGANPRCIFLCAVVNLH